MQKYRKLTFSPPALLPRYALPPGTGAAARRTSRSAVQILYSPSESADGRLHPGLQAGEWHIHIQDRNKNRIDIEAFLSFLVRFSFPNSVWEQGSLPALGTTNAHPGWPNRSPQFVHLPPTRPAAPLVDARIRAILLFVSATGHRTPENNRLENSLLPAHRSEAATCGGTASLSAPCSLDR